MPTNSKSVSGSDAAKAAAEAVATPGTTPPAEKKPPHEGVASFAYIGPSLPGGRLIGNALLCGTYGQITEYYGDVIAEYPDIASLIVPVSGLAESRKKAQKGGNLVNEHYKRVAAAIKAKAKGEGE
jgi:hypothetical protein